MTQTLQQTRLAAARQQVAAKRSEIAALGDAKRAKNREADQLVPAAKNGDTKAAKRVIALEDEMSGLGGEILKIERALGLDTQNLLNVEGESRAATARLRDLERAADLWAGVFEHLAPASEHLSEIKRAMWERQGAFSSQEVEAIRRVINFIDAARATFNHLEAARQYVAEVGAWDES